MKGGRLQFNCEVVECGHVSSRAAIGALADGGWVSEF
jgi:hypothetical protein